MSHLLHERQLKPIVRQASTPATIAVAQDERRLLLQLPVVGDMLHRSGASGQGNRSSPIGRYSTSLLPGLAVGDHNPDRECFDAPHERSSDIHLLRRSGSLGQVVGSSPVVRSSPVAKASVLPLSGMFFDAPHEQHSETDTHRLETCKSACPGSHDGPCGRQYILYHGTTSAAGKQIMAHGFEPSVGGKFGPGVYLARDIADAQIYAESNFDKKKGVIIKCSVCLGKCLHKKGIARDNAWMHRGFDSVFNDAEFPEYCVLDPNRVHVLANLKNLQTN